MSRIRLYRTEAIVLKRRDFGEADRILTLYTPSRGKVAAIARGVRRIVSRKSGHVELFTHSLMLLAEGRNLDVVTQAETLRSFQHIRTDLMRATYAYHIAELVDRFTPDREESPPAFELLRDTLGALDEADDPSLVARYFELRMLGLVGYRPQLFGCVACGGALEPEGNSFSPEAGGVLCPQCSLRHADAVPLSPVAFRVLRFMQRREWAVARCIKLTPATRGDLERTMYVYIRYLLERELKSTEFLKGLRKLTPEVDARPGPTGSGKTGTGN